MLSIVGMGCTEKIKKQALLGIWVYSASKTIKENNGLLNKRISEKELQSRRDVYVFEESRTIYTMLPIPVTGKGTWYEWEILEINQKMALLDVGGIKTSLIRDKGCLGFRLDETEKALSYVEYYCKK